MFSGELPPKSVHGVAISNEINVKFLLDKYQVVIDEEYLDLRFHQTLHSSKFQNFVGRLKRIISLSFKNKFDFFYIVFSVSTAGAIKTFLIILFFKSFNYSSRCIVHVHRGDLDIFVKRSYLNRFFLYFVIKLTHRLIVLSEQTKEFIEFQFGTSSCSIFVLPNTVNIEPIVHESLEEQNRTNSLKKFVFISNYIEEKGILLLLETFKQLGARFQLHCYGNFSDLNLKSKIMAYNSDYITINGPIFNEDKFLVIKESDALILPSFNEGKPIVLLEAMSIGTPFISSNVGYIKEMVFDDYPFIYDNHTVACLKEMIIKFSLISKVDKIYLQDNLREHYFEHYSNEKHKSKLFQIFSN